MVTACSLAEPWCSAPAEIGPRSKLNCSTSQQVLFRRFCQYSCITPSNHLLLFFYWSSPIPLAIYSGLNHRKCSRREAAYAHHTTHDDLPSTKCTQMLFRSFALHTSAAPLARCCSNLTKRCQHCISHVS